MGSKGARHRWIGGADLRRPIGGSLVALADDAPKAAGGANSDAARVAEGRTLYANHCSHCHNAGNVVPGLREFSGDEARFADTVTHGKNNRMPPWGDLLSPVKIKQLWAYIQTKGKP